MAGKNQSRKGTSSELLRAKVSVFIELAINKNLEMEISERMVSERKVQELYHKLLENIARLENANKDLDQFAFMASHDLQEPLSRN